MKKFYSGVAMAHPKENHDVRTGWRIALKRAYDAIGVTNKWIEELMPLAHYGYRHAWHEIRSQLREQEMKEKATQ